MAKKKSDKISPRVVVLYEATTGKVRYMHYSMAARGAKLPSNADLEKRALELATRLYGLPIETLRTLQVDAIELKHGSRHRVDIETERVISEPLTRMRE